jgi:hypothetical protein
MAYHPPETSNKNELPDLATIHKNTFNIWISTCWLNQNSFAFLSETK